MYTRAGFVASSRKLIMSESSMIPAITGFQVFPPSRVSHGK